MIQLMHSESVNNSMQVINRLFASIILIVSSSSYCEEVTMLFGRSLEPYVIEKGNQGAELLIIKEALEHKGHELVPIYTQLKFVPLLFSGKGVKAVHRNFEEEGVENRFYGDVSVIYHDVFFSLEENNIVIHRPDDLKKHSLVTFQDAQIHYPQWLPEHSKYSQVAEQITQVKLLQKGLTDLVMADRNIFSYKATEYSQLTGEQLKPMRMHEFVPPYEYRPMFKSQQIAKDFNEGLKVLKKSGRYDEIIASAVRENTAIVRTFPLSE